MEQVHGITVWLGPPEALERAWLEWVAAVGRGWTMTPAAPLAAHLAGRAAAVRTPGDHRVVRWDDLAVQALAPGTVVVPFRGLAARLAAALVRRGDGPWRERPGAAAALVETVLRLRREGVPPERLARLGAGPAAWVRAGYEAVETLLGGAVEESRVRLAAGHALAGLVRDGPLAWYGAFLGSAPARAAASLATGGPRAVFVPRAGGRADAAVQPWVRWWIRRGARVVRLEGASPAVVEGVTAPARGLVGPVVAEAWAGRAGPDPVVVTRDAESAELLASGLPPGREDGDDRRGRWLLAWEAADAGASFETVLAWLGVAGFAGPGDRLRVARSGPYRDRWPASVLKAWTELVEARRAVLRAPDWRAAGRAVDRFATAAGVPSPLTEGDRAALAAWDGLGTLVPTPQDIEAWAMELGDHQPGRGTGVGPWSEWAGGFFERLVVVLDPGGFEDGGPDSPLLDVRAERALGLLPTSVRDRWLAAVLPWSARHLVVVRTAGRPWPRFLPPAAERLWRPAAGPGLVRPPADRIDPFPPGAVPPPATVTGFERYGRCPLAYAWERLGFQPLWQAGDEPAADLMGLWLHDALERLGPRPPDAGDAHAAAAAAVEAAIARHPAPPTFLPDVVAGVTEGLVADVVRYLLDPVEGTPVATEWPFRVAWGAGTVSGRVDRVERRGEAWWVVDFKSGRLPPARVGPASLQLAVYAGAVAAGFGVPPEAVRAEFVGVRHRTNQHQRRALDGHAGRWWPAAATVLTGVVERIVQGRLPPFPEPGACRACPWRAACPTGVEAARARLTDADPVFAALWQPAGEGEDDGDATA